MFRTATMEQTMNNCACGKPLHYSDPLIEEAVNRIIATQGEYVTVKCDGKEYSVQRHFIALHGLRAAELPMLVSVGVVAEI